MAQSKIQDQELSFKDVALDQTARTSNVAQFVSFSPQLKQRFSWIRGFSPNEKFSSADKAIETLLNVAPEASVNVRSFLPWKAKGGEFTYGVRKKGEVTELLSRLAANGMYTLVNETVNVLDGGVSGVVFGNLIEFAPEDTPRCVEKPGTAGLPRDLGIRLLKNIYHFQPELDFKPGLRVEFSLHPLKRGYRNEHTIIWELEDVGEIEIESKIVWPNRFSRFLGDKTFGLLVADNLGLLVPRSTVISRKVAPFSFGKTTGTTEFWIRTSPAEQIAGHFTTKKGWSDPFNLLGMEDAQGGLIASVIAQEGVNECYAGALATTEQGHQIIEGVRGPKGPDFMAGRASPEELPSEVIIAVSKTSALAAKQLGPVRIEWVYDGAVVWVVQLHIGSVPSHHQVIYPGQVNEYERFDVTLGLEALRDLILTVKGNKKGIILVGRVGVTSHFGDILRKSKIPSRIEF